MSPRATAHPTEKSLFLFQKNLGGGSFKKYMQRVFLAGRSGQTCPLGGVALGRDSRPHSVQPKTE